MKILIKVTLFSVVLLALVLSAGVVGLHLYTDLKLYPAIVSSQESIKPYEKFIQADLRTLEKAPIFKNNEYKKDATAFLQTRIPFDGIKSAASDSKQNKIVEDIFQKYPNWLNSNLDFKGLTSEPGFAELDPKWMEQLKNFDHWNWTSGPEMQERIHQARGKYGVEKIEALSTLPIPNFALLRNWSVVYAIKKLQTKELHIGLKVYRKVAELSNSTGTLVGQMQAVMMLKAEHKMMHDFEAKDWQLVPLRSIEAYRRLSWAWMHIVREPFYSELKPEFKNYTQASYGICGAAQENMNFLFGVRDFLEPQISFETSFSQNYIRAQQFQEGLLAKCHLDDFTHLIESSSLAEETNWLSAQQIFPIASLTTATPDGFFSKLIQHVNWTRIPFARKYIGLTIFSLATPDGLNQYREYANEKNKN